MASELRVNSSTNRSGLGTITYTDSGLIVSGVGTFANGLTVDGTQTTVKSLRLTGDNYSANWFKTSSVFRLNDNAKLNLGSADDMQQYHDGTTSWIKNTTGVLRIENTVSNIGVYASHGSGDIIMRAGGATSSENAIVAVHHGEVVLSFNGSTKLTTTNTGVTIAGTAVAGALDISGDIDVDGHTNLDNVSVAGVSTFSSAVNVKKTSGSALLKLENTNGSSYLDIRHTNGYGAVHIVHQGTEKWRVGQTAQADHFSVYQSSSVSDGLPYRFFIQNNGEVGINTSDPTNTLHLLRNNANHGITLQKAGTNPGTATINVSSYGALALTAANNFNITSGGSQQIIFNRGGTAVGNFDTSGALNIGRNPAQATGTNTQNAILTIKGYPNSETSAAILALVRGNDTTSTANNHTLGRIVFSDKQAGEYAFIEGEADANGAVGDTPGRLVFSTAPDNTSAPTEKLRISSDGSAYFYHGTTNHVMVSGTGFCNSVGASPSGAGVCLAVGRDGGSNRSIHSQGHIRIANGYGIQFESSSTSAVLDDFEEGTFSPYYTDGQNTQFSQHTSGYAYGEYVKIGKLVYFTCGVRCSGYDRTPSGRVFLHGLPFVSKNYGDDDEPIFSMQSRLWGSGNPPKLARMQQGTGGVGRSRIALQMGAHLATNESPLQGSDFDTSATCRVVISGHYMVP